MSRKMTPYEAKDEAEEIIESIKNYDADDLRQEKLYYRITELQKSDVFKGKQAETELFARAKELKIAKQVNELLKAYRIRQAQKSTAIGGNCTEFTDQPVTLDCGSWIADDRGIRKVVISNNGETETKIASTTPIVITAIFKNIEMQENNEKIKLAYRDNGIWKTMIVPNSIICEARRITELAGNGIDVTSNTAKYLIDYLRDIKTGNRDKIPVLDSIGHLGWTEDGRFAPYDDIAFDGDAKVRPLYQSVSRKGDYEAWKKYVGKLRKNICLRLQMAASFASPLLYKLNTLPFILHFHGGTENGKTVGMIVAASIWGDPRPGKMWRTLNNTINFAMTSAAAFHHLPCMFDELQTIKTKMNYDEFIMRMCTGIDRGRMNGSAMEETKTWLNAILTTGEDPIVRDNSGGGSINRVIEIDCTDKVIATNGKEIVRFLSDNYGYAGKEFIEKISGHTNLNALFDDIYTKLMNQTNTADKQGSSMAAMMLADLLAGIYIFPNEEPLTVADVAPFLADKSRVDVSERAYDYVLDLIAVNSNKFGSDAIGECWGDIKEDGTVLFNKSILVSKMNDSGFVFDAVKKKWKEKKYIIPNSQGRLVHNTRCNGIKANYIKIAQKPETPENLPSAPPF